VDGAHVIALYYRSHASVKTPDRRAGRTLFPKVEAQFRSFLISSGTSELKEGASRAGE
jgi:hypothetical protein